MTNTIHAILQAVLLVTLTACNTSGEGPVCTHQCTSDEDCLVAGDNIGLSCVDSLCAASAAVQCTNRTKCTALFSGWSTLCTAGGDECAASEEVCVAVDGGGRCAIPARGDSCGGSQFRPTEVKGIAGETIKVCGNTAAACGDDGLCFARCRADSDCLSAPAPLCNVDTGLCECGQDSDCAHLGRPEATICEAGVCGCASDQACEAGGAGDVCHAGVCGCTNTRACAAKPHIFDGGAVRCVD